MSTILQALRELEGKIAPAEVAAWAAEQRRWRWVGAALAGGAVVAVIGGVAFFFLHRGNSAPPRAPAVAVEAAPPSLTAPLEARPVPQPAMPPVAKVVPPARMPPVAKVVPAPTPPVAKPVGPRPEAPPAAAVVVPQATVAPSPPPADEPAGAVVTSPLPAPARPAAPVPNPDRPAGAVRSSGEPRIQVHGIRYSSTAPERVVTLAVDGGTPITLHQGESMGDLEIQLILPDAVYVRQGGRVWMVSRDR